MKTKRWLSWFIVFLMLISLTPTVSFAAEGTLAAGEVKATKEKVGEMDANGLTTIKLSVAGKEKETKTGADVILIVDKSGSMSNTINYTCDSTEYTTKVCGSTAYKANACGSDECTANKCGSTKYYTAGSGRNTEYYCSGCNKRLFFNKAPDSNWKCQNVVSYTCDDCGYTFTTSPNRNWTCPNITSYTCSNCGLNLGATKPADGWTCTNAEYTCSECGKDLGNTKPATDWVCGNNVTTNRMDLAKKASTAFINNVIEADSDNNVAVIGFSSTGYNHLSDSICCDFTNSTSAAIGKITNMSANGGTDYTEALDKAISYAEGRSNKTKPLYVVMMSDGAPGASGESPDDTNWNGINQAATLKGTAYNATICTIGIGLGSDNASALKAISTVRGTKTLYWSVGVNSMLADLKDAFDTIVGDIHTTAAGRNTVMTDVVNLTDFEWVGFVGDPANATYNSVTGTITWTIGDTTLAGQSIQFQVRLKAGNLAKGGTYNTNTDVKVEYTNVDGAAGIVIPKDNIGDPKVVAAPQSFAITYAATTGGAVSSTGETVVYGTPAKGSTAIADTNYTFDGWYDGASLVTTSAIFVPDTTVAKAYTAKFTEKTVVISYNSDGHGTVSPATETVGMATGTVAGSTATAAANYYFVNWTSGSAVVSTSAAIIPAKAAGTYTANFKLNTFAIKYVAETGGTVNSPGETVDYGTAAQGARATADTNYTFDGWYDGAKLLTTAAFYAPTVTEAKTYTAKFTENTVVINYLSGGNGTVSPEQETVFMATGTVKGSTAAAVENYHFVNWTSGSAVVSTRAAFTPAKAAGTYTANFAINTFAVKYEAQTGGTVSSAGETVDYGTSAAGSTATADTNYTFAGWYDGDALVTTAAAIAPGTITGAKTYTARFTENTVVINYLTDGNGTVSRDTETVGLATGTVKGTTASAIENYHFVNWTNADKVVVGTDPAFKPAKENGTYTANFAIDTFAIAYEAGTGGTVSSAGEIVAYGGNATGSTATPDTNYTFAGWYDGTEQVSSDLTFAPSEITGAKTYTAMFTEKEKYAVNFYKEDGTTPITTTQSIYLGSAATKPADPTKAETTSATYVFAGWVPVNTDVNYTIDSIKNVTQEMSFKATFTETIKRKHHNTDPTVIIPEEEVAAGPLLNTTDHFAYIQGYPEAVVKPQGNVTREEVAAVFYRLLDSTYRDTITKTDSSFQDVAGSRWSSKYIATLSNGKIIEGYTDGSFNPSAYITRAELATIASRFSELAALDTNSFTDIDTHWAKEYINSAAEKGWVNGYADGTFKPDQYITRAEFVTLVNNVLGRDVNDAGILSDAKTFSDLKAGAWYYDDMEEAINSHNYERNAEGVETWTEITFPSIAM